MRIKYTLGKTVNVGNYNSVRIELSAEDDSNGQPTKEASHQTLYESLREFVTTRVAEEEARLRAEAKASA
jgi:putative lipoic acid-binding regulatory protein